MTVVAERRSSSPPYEAHAAIMSVFVGGLGRLLTWSLAAADFLQAGFAALTEEATSAAGAAARRA